MSHRLSNGIEAKVISPIYFIATKTEAFRNRGKDDYRSSHDFEDIVNLVNGRAELVEEMKSADPKVRNAMREYWLPRLDSGNLIGAVQEHMDAFEENRRTLTVMNRLREMLSP